MKPCLLAISWALECPAGTWTAKWLEYKEFVTDTNIETKTNITFTTLKSETKRCFEKWSFIITLWGSLELRETLLLLAPLIVFKISNSFLDNQLKSIGNAQPNPYIYTHNNFIEWSFQNYPQTTKTPRPKTEVFVIRSESILSNPICSISQYLQNPSCTLH
jgi:hypothetical protein